MSGSDDTWELAVVWRDPDRGWEPLRSHRLTGLTERQLCDLLGMPGTKVPYFPVVVTDAHLAVLQPFADEPLDLPRDTTGELRPAGAASNGPTSRRWPLVVEMVFSLLLSILCWTAAVHASTGWTRALMQFGGIVFGLLTLWFALWLALMTRLVRTANRRGDDPRAGNGP